MIPETVAGPDSSPWYGGDSSTQSMTEMSRPLGLNPDGHELTILRKRSNTLICAAVGPSLVHISEIMSLAFKNNLIAGCLTGSCLMMLSMYRLYRGRR